VADVPAETIVIRDRSRLRQEPKAFGADESRNAAIRRVMLALVRDAEPEDMSAKDAWTSCRSGTRHALSW
jgi:hypothetical protein